MYKFIDWDSKHINKLELKKAIKNDLKNIKKDDLTDLIALLITEDICVGEKENMYNGYMKQYAKNRDRVSDSIKKSHYEINPVDFLEKDNLTDLDNFLHENIFSHYENDKFDVHTFDYKIVLDMERELLWTEHYIKN